MLKYVWIVKVKCRYVVYYGFIQNKYNMKFILNFLNKNTCRYKNMYVILK